MRVHTPPDTGFLQSVAMHVCAHAPPSPNTHTQDRFNLLTCMYVCPPSPSPSPQTGFLWAGYVNGCVAMYHVHKAAVAAEKLAVADATITALAVDAQTGLCWAGTEEGVVVIVR